MKKLFKTLSVLLILVLTFVLTGCGANVEEKNAEFVVDMENFAKLENYTIETESEITIDSVTTKITYTLYVTDTAIYEQYKAVSETGSEDATISGSYTVSAVYTITDHEAEAGKVCYKVFTKQGDTDWYYSFEQYDEGTKLIDIPLVTTAKLEIDGKDFCYDKELKAFYVLDSAKEKYDVTEMNIRVSHGIISTVNPFTETKMSKVVISYKSKTESLTMTVSKIGKTKVTLPENATLKDAIKDVDHILPEPITPED